MVSVLLARLGLTPLEGDGQMQRGTCLWRQKGASACWRGVPPSLFATVSRLVPVLQQPCKELYVQPQVDCATHADSLQCLFGGKVDCAFSAYRPKFERIPPEAARTALYRAVVTLGPDGTLSQQAGRNAPPASRGAPSPLQARAFSRLPVTLQGRSARLHQQDRSLRQPLP